LYRRTPGRGPADRRAAQPAACDSGPGAGRHVLAAGLPASSALSVRVGQVRRAGAATARCGRRTRTYGTLLARDRARAPRGDAVRSLVEVRDLVKYYAGQRSGLGLGRPWAPVRAVDGVSFGMRGGKTLGLVGEWGSGKTTVGRTMPRLQEPTSGKMLFAAQDV